MPVKHQPSYYLTEEAAERRIEKLIERIAKVGLRPGESVPDHIMSRVMALRFQWRRAA